MLARLANALKWSLRNWARQHAGLTQRLGPQVVGALQRLLDEVHGAELAVLNTNQGYAQVLERIKHQACGSILCSVCIFCLQRLLVLLATKGGENLDKLTKRNYVVFFTTVGRSRVPGGGQDSREHAYPLPPTRPLRVYSLETKIRVCGQDYLDSAKSFNGLVTTS